ncbi:hypothetical protein TVAG_068770 [Trichomonas vaginalis G3]|uniref:Right handed beta helix domain-containing protein n=1 Tax=Trichomonas vaginalis (strain ATCC PRA-98 / G3) TaxID=412133 RepID=A2EZK3_TRIV3|nr:pectin lyase-like family [Trichomonas vaginalis G3]EAY01911.1 hypothetical protein TVAG_068770 [Trichomonas vaginalis G3]KAI5485281.1 pectin lyase-like family [Trichomonas vaginalis G3]|eukprot:XP_001314450.1 hypothetical protein [Trichomonas vaginalis G3]
MLLLLASFINCQSILGLVSRLSALTTVSNVSLISKPKVQNLYKSSPIFFHVPGREIRNLVIRGTTFDKAQSPISFGSCNIQLDNDLFTQCVSVIVSSDKLVFDADKQYKAINSSITISRCIFNIFGDIQKDAPISIERCDMKIERSVFESCVGGEGIIYASNSNVTIRVSNFSQCVSYRYPGCIHAINSKVNLYYMRFLDNEAAGLAGVGRFYNCSFHGEKVDCLFNKAFMHVSTFLFESCNSVILVRCKFLRNYCTMPFDGSDQFTIDKQSGTLSFNDCPSVYIQYCTFIGNMMDDQNTMQPAIYAMGSTKINTYTCQADQNLDTFSVLVEDTSGQVPILKNKRSIVNSYIPNMYKHLIYMRDKFYHKVTVLCASAMSQNYIIATFVVSVLVIIIVAVTMSVMSGGFI